jgi:hypothetical protein
MAFLTGQMSNRECEYVNERQTNSVTYNGVLPSLSRGLAEAPYENKSSQKAVCPNTAARCLSGDRG